MKRDIIAKVSVHDNNNVWGELNTSTLYKSVGECRKVRRDGAASQGWQHWTIPSLGLEGWGGRFRTHKKTASGQELGAPTEELFTLEWPCREGAEEVNDVASLTPLPPAPAGASCSRNLSASQVVLVVNNPTANAGDVRDAGSIPGPGRSSPG